jgi:hypothetical protein
MSKRRSEQIQPTKGKSAETHISRTAPEGANPVELPETTSATATTNPNELGKYWIVIILWAASFTLMILFELMSALFRR